MSTVLVTTDAGVTTIRIDRLAKKNALDGATYRGLADAFAGAAADPAGRAIVLTGGPDVFTAGNDLADFARVSAGEGGLDAIEFLRALIDCPLPIVAAVSGWAVGIGTTMLLHCDLVYASPSARFRTPFVELGLCPEAASSLLLPSTIGARAAIEMLYLGTELDAARAVALGLVTSIVEDPLAHASSVAARLAALPPGALRATKSLVRRPSRAALDAALAAEQEAFLAQLRSDEARTAVLAMLSRRR